MSTPVSSSVLFHCWRHEDTTHARSVLKSICKNGLLLTTNAATLDIFSINRGQGVIPMEVQQHARVCFTDIPVELLQSHGQRYGKYGVGFRRETVIDWGGLPAWYLPNYWSDKTLKSVGPVLVNGLHAAMDTAKQMKALAHEFAAKNIPFSIAYKQGSTLQADQLVKEMEQISSSIFAVLSFIKEMSPQSSEDYSYLFEREWRIVSGFGLAGQPAAFRTLTQDEKSFLVSRNAIWGKSRQSEDINIIERYGAAPVIDSFQYFNGLPEKPKVAELIATILVPEESEALWVADFLAEQSSLFGSAVPQVTIFPG